MKTHSALFALALATVLLAACGSEEPSGTDQFRDETESRILDFGAEASEAESEQASSVVSAFLAARSAGAWREACEQIAGALVAKLESLAASATNLTDKSCPSILNAFAQISPAELSEEGTEGGSLRHAGKRGFLIYSCADEAVCAMPVEKDGGEWKVGAIIARRLS